ncbi:TIGR00341 family protein [Halobacterium litoreum]|uniref:TIGR00341 family protein n=1 Tax=Halobacterium litoreum TaxID=2039234 RepID=A0ABD5NHQ8_9EURY|nr:TIGR00341 family protein [Halobacterium litoreum]UHH12539.1 TIGR00341 family protein [Halobacterium litoreum]
MRLVQFALPADSRESVLAVLDDEGVDYVLVDGADDTLVEFPLPAQAVEPVLSELRDAGLDDRYVVVASAESAVTERFDDLEARYVEGSEADESIDPDELAATARDMTPNAATYYSMTVLSAVVALAGLLLDSPALVVGSMVIAPQVGSALTAAVGVVLADRGMIRSGLRAQVVGLTVAVAGAAAVGWLVQAASFVPGALDVTTVTQISQRISPGALSLVVGLAAGAAGSLGLATALPVSLVGVMIAAALIPAAAAVGVGIAWGLPVVAAGAALLLASNFAAINVVSPAVLWTLGYRPADWGDAPWRRYARVGAVVLVLGAAFAGAAALTADQMAFERDANRAVADTLDADEYDDLTLVGVRSTVPVAGGDYGVTVVVERPDDRSYPELAGRIRGALADRTGRLVPVEVQFVDRDRVPP